MLLTWFVIVLILALVLILFGYYLNQPPLAISGSALLFLLGVVVMFSQIYTQSGYTETTLAPCDGNCTEIRSGETINSYLITNTSVIYDYSPILEEEVIGIGINHLLGFFLALIGVFVFIDVMFNLRGLK